MAIDADFAGERNLSAISAADAVVLLPSLGRFGDSRSQEVILGYPLSLHVRLISGLAGVEFASFAGIRPADRAREVQRSYSQSHFSFLSDSSLARLVNFGHLSQVDAR